MAVKFNNPCHTSLFCCLYLCFLFLHSHNLLNGKISLSLKSILQHLMRTLNCLHLKPKSKMEVNRAWKNPSMGCGILNGIQRQTKRRQIFSPMILIVHNGVKFQFLPIGSSTQTIFHCIAIKFIPTKSIHLLCPKTTIQWGAMFVHFPYPKIGISIKCFCTLQV
ncbi:MAG: Uncharacterised protein [Flavobacteriaceae bacterium]|nr:MAG: Uncharacterised protein [Flavobacteriaceae bacterium]